MIYTEIVAKLIPQTQQRLWIATADIKDMYVEWQGDMVPFLKILADLIGKGVEIEGNDLTTDFFGNEITSNNIGCFGN